jgi:hypothetical protein
MLPKLDSTSFTWQRWRAGSIHDFDIPCRYLTITSGFSKMILKEHAVGWSYGENLPCRPKENHIAVMFEKDDRWFWFHMRRNEFDEVFRGDKND